MCIVLFFMMGDKGRQLHVYTYHLCFLSVHTPPQVKSDLLEMTNSALCEYLLDKAMQRAAEFEAAGGGGGVPGWAVLTKPQLQSLLAHDRHLGLQPLQVLSLLRLAKPTPMPAHAAASPNAAAGSSPSPSQFVEVAEFIPLAAATIENMFDPKFLVSSACARA